MEDTDDFKSEKVCSLLFKQIDRPDNFELCKAINVYDNKYRINVYTRIWDDIWQIEKKRITHSYFAKLEGDSLELVA